MHLLGIVTEYSKHNILILPYFVNLPNLGLFQSPDWYVNQYTFRMKTKYWNNPGIEYHAVTVPCSPSAGTTGSHSCGTRLLWKLRRHMKWIYQILWWRMGVNGKLQFMYWQSGGERFFIFLLYIYLFCIVTWSMRLEIQYLP